MNQTQVAIPEAVMEKVHAELCRSILDTPDFIKKVVDDLLKEPKPNSSWQDSDPDKGKPLFERVLRRELRTMIERSMMAALREKYQPAVDTAIKQAMDEHEMVEGSLAQAFAKVIAEDWRVNIDTKFEFRRAD